MPDLLLRLLTASWNGLPIASLGIFAVGGLMYVWMSRTPTAASPSAITARRPGWIARRRARGGIKHRAGRVGVGYASATRSVHLSLRELAGHGLTVGGPGSGKTTFLQLLVEASAERVPCVIVDPKGSPALEATVRAHGGQVWTLDGRLPADLLDPRPWQVPDLLLEAEDYSADARAYRDAAHQRALWAAWSLALDGRPMDLSELRRRLDRETLTVALERHRGRDSRIGDWLTRLVHQHGGIEDSGARGLDRALGTLLDGVALRGSLRCCPEALRLEDALDTNGLVLFSLDAAEYPHATRKVASWILLGMGRLARQLPSNRPLHDERAVPLHDERALPRALLLVDEVGALGHSARHLRGLVGRAREAGLSVVMATQGLTDLEAVDRALVDQVLQDTAFQVVFRQGSPRDAHLVEALFGQAWVVDESWRSDGVVTKRQVERWRVPVDEWMNGLQPGDAWLRVAPVDRGWRQERVRVALPRPPVLNSERGIVRREPRIVESDTKARTTRRQYPRDVSEQADSAPRVRALPTVPPECPPELVERMGADVLAKVERRWSRKHHEIGPCLVWREGEPTYKAAGGLYGRIYDPALGRTDYTHRVVWRRCYGPIPKGLTVDHRCDVTLCQRPDHLQLLTRGDNTRRRHRRTVKTHAIDGETLPTTAAGRFDIALFARIDKPTVQSKTATLDELVTMLGQFEVLNDKHRGRCWSPTKYTDGATSRGNAGVESVSCLVFDLDRVPPDEKRLAGVYWLGHTTHSHTPLAPRWRVVIPLTAPVPAASWRDVWLRARAALCPEADPVCKDPSRAYWLPSHNGGVSAKTARHTGLLLDPSTLPALPPEPRRSASRPVRANAGDGRRAEAYMATVIANVEEAAPGGRNAALNHAAWTLGRWIAAGALEQGQVEDALYAAAERNGLVADDGQRQTWATIRSGLGAGLREAVDLNAER